MKYFYITLALLVLFYTFYYLSPVEYLKESPKALCKEEPSRLAKCENTCMGVPIITCKSTDLCVSTCNGMCYGAIKSKCSNYEAKKLGPIELAKDMFNQLNLF